MPLYVLACIDKAQSLQVRMGAREAHLAWAGARRGEIKLAGPFLDENGDMAGSMFVLDEPDLDAARAFNAEDPYTLAGLWERVDIRPFRVTIGSV
jgi:uncharacterized protein YciI